MPFVSKAQMRKCYALKLQGKSGSWNYDEWLAETKNPENLPERVKEAQHNIIPLFSKLAKRLLDPKKAPPIPERVSQAKEIRMAQEDRKKGMDPVTYRNEATSRHMGLIQRNRQTPMVS